jgi:alpha-ketoglutarate-dependent taurine dioxygenase
MTEPQFTTGDEGLVIVGCRPAGAAEWIRECRTLLRAAATRYGAVLVRGLGVGSIADAVEVADSFMSTRFVEREGFAPRDLYEPGIYSSTRWPPDQPMCMHHELSYASEVPRWLVVSCLRAPERGGATAVADARRVLDDLPFDCVDRFSRLGWQLRRNYSPLLGTPWQDAFGGDDPREVERYCREHAIEFHWNGEDKLTTSQQAPAVIWHPATGERCWFNQIAFLNEWTLDPVIHDYLTTEFGPEYGLPFNTAYGDGEPIHADVVTAINTTYDRHTVREPWRDGDVLFIDNLAAAHSTEPYEGPRDIVVAMGDGIAVSELVDQGRRAETPAFHGSAVARSRVGGPP